MEHNPAELHSSELTQDIDIAALRAEVTKWQERVPKLAGALRERTEELSAARDQIRELKNKPRDDHDAADVDARLRTRDVLIQDLEAKLADLNSRHQQLSGEVHASKMASDAATDDARSWKQKWQEVATALDDEGRQRADAEQALRTLRTQLTAELNQLKSQRDNANVANAEEITALRKRNQQLTETAELTGKQLATLSDELSQLVGRVEQEREQRQSAEAAAEAANARVQQAEQALQQAQQALQQAQSQAEQALAQAQTQADQALEQAQTQAQQAFEQAQSQAAQDLQQARTQAENALQDAQAQAETAKSEAAQSLAELQQQHQVELEQLRQQTDQQIAAEQQRTAEQVAQAQQQAEAESAESLQAQKDLFAAHTQQQELALQEAREEHARVQQQLDAVQQQSQQADAGHSETLQQAQAEIERLQLCVEAAQTSQPRMENERALLTNQVTDLQAEVVKLKASLEERSTLVRELEAEHNSSKMAQQDVNTTIEQLRTDLAAAQQRVATYQEHNGSLERRMQDQRGLLENLERELSDEQSRVAKYKKSAEAQQKTLAEFESQHSAVQTRQSDHEVLLQDELAATQAELAELKATLVAVRAESADASELQTTKDQVRDLELKLRDRTKELDELRWREKQNEQPADDKMVLILNQQLQDARDEIDRLKHKQGDQATDAQADDLTQLHGVGAKLAEQLADTGVTTFRQIADLDVTAIQAEEHPLYAFKSRIQRDGWVDQAKALINP